MLIGAALVLVTALPPLAVRLVGSAASPRTLAALYLLSLLGVATLPAVGAGCLAGTAAWVVGWAQESWPPCPLGSGAGAWGMLGLAAGAAVAGALLGAAVLQAAWARRVELRGAAQARATIRRVPSGARAWVVPSAIPIAFTGGLLQPKIVVSTGLLALLEEDEQAAVLEHEAAHLRAGHARLLILGGAVAGLYAWLPTVASTWAGLRRELEVVADDEAVRHVGKKALLHALAKVALAQVQATPLSAAALADPDHLRYRIHRLGMSASPCPVISAAVIGLIGFLVALVGLALCQAISQTPSIEALAACTVSLVALIAWPWRPFCWRAAHIR